MERLQYWISRCSIFNKYPSDFAIASKVYNHILLDINMYVYVSSFYIPATIVLINCVKKNINNKCVSNSINYISFYLSYLATIAWPSLNFAYVISVHIYINKYNFMLTAEFPFFFSFPLSRLLYASRKPSSLFYTPERW